MKNKRIIFLALLVACSFTFVVMAQMRPPVKSLAGVKVEINSYGVLTSLKDANGNDFFGKESAPLYDGYSLAYYITDAKTGQPELRVIYANSNQVSKESLIPQQDIKAATEKVKNHLGLFEIPVLTSLVRTSDGAFEILTQYGIAEKTGELVVARRFKNISESPLKVIGIEARRSARIAPGRSGTKRPLPQDGGHFPHFGIFRGPRSTGPIFCPEDFFNRPGTLIPGAIPESVVTRCMDCNQQTFDVGEAIPEEIRQKLNCQEVTVTSWVSRRRSQISNPIKPGETVALFSGNQLAKTAHRHK